MKTSELNGPLLDYWVAKAEGENPVPDNLRPSGFIIRNGWCVGSDYTPSTRWEQAGPIIEREKIRAEYRDKGVWMGGYGENYWIASYRGGLTEKGATPLVAVMRAFVASKFGEYVPDRPRPPVHFVGSPSADVYGSGQRTACGMDLILHGPVEWANEDHLSAVTCVACRTQLPDALHAE